MKLAAVRCARSLGSLTSSRPHRGADLSFQWQRPHRLHGCNGRLVLGMGPSTDMARLVTFARTDEAITILWTHSPQRKGRLLYLRSLGSTPRCAFRPICFTNSCQPAALLCRFSVALSRLRF